MLDWISTTMSGEFECSICLEYYSNTSNDRFVVTHCGHIYHKLCIDGHLAINPRSNCPYCRNTMTPFVTLGSVEAFKREKKFKIVTVGDSGVGKTCLTWRFLSDSYSDNTQSTMHVDFLSKTVKIADELVTLHVWDTNGEEKRAIMTAPYVRHAQGVIICYSTQDEKSLMNTRFWLNFVNGYAPNAIKVLVGCKNDIPPGICSNKMCREKSACTCKSPTETQITELAESLGLTNFETSAKNAYNVQAVFRDVTIQILRNKFLTREARLLDANRGRAGTIHLEELGGPNPTPPASGGCC